MAQQVFVALVIWLSSMMMKWSPIIHHTRSHIPEAQESQEQGEKRYRENAEAIIRVAYDPNEKPLFWGPYARARTAVLIASIAYFESGFRRDVDTGIGKYARGDGGRSHCPMQIQTGVCTKSNCKGTVPDTDPVVSTWTGKDLTDDRNKCYRAGLHVLRRAMSACASLPPESRLSAYASGKCDAAEIKGKVRFRHAAKKFNENKPAMKDAETLLPVKEPSEG